ncbi:hypothetical protein FBU30_002847, partial [Linnemannia zychae]
DKTNIIIYIDGELCEEKRSTHDTRQRRRSEAAYRARLALDNLNEHISRGLRVRKRTFSPVQKHLKACFRWEEKDRNDFILYMRGRSWEVVQCDFEADPQIASGCQNGDVVVSHDSDFFAYRQVQALWRPRGRGRSLVLCYHVPQILKTLELTRPQLTALCIVTSNDYTKNIASVGINSNYAIIKNIQGIEDVNQLVEAYCADKTVQPKIKNDQDFEASLRVFLSLQQTRRTSSAVSEANSENGYSELRKDFASAREQYNERQKLMSESKALDK